MPCRRSSSIYSQQWTWNRSERERRKKTRRTKSRWFATNIIDGIIFFTCLVFWLVNVRLWSFLSIKVTFTEFCSGTTLGSVASGLKWLSFCSGLSVLVSRCVRRWGVMLRNEFSRKSHLSASCIRFHTTYVGLNKLSFLACLLKLTEYTYFFKKLFPFQGPLNMNKYTCFTDFKWNVNFLQTHLKDWLYDRFVKVIFFISVITYNWILSFSCLNFSLITSKMFSSYPSNLDY